MAKMKLTPFYLFILLLIVLVISIIFGYNNNVFEGATTMVGSTHKSSVQHVVLFRNDPG